MKTFNRFFLFIFLCTIFTSCNQKKTKKPNEHLTLNKNLYVEIIGNYVSSEYGKRNEGYDWVSIAVTKASDSTIHIRVRSRADKKKPTCTFDADALKLNDTTYQSSFEGKNILFTFNKTSISIKTEKEEDLDLLNYFCSGGGSLADTYTKIDDEIDENQIDKRVFQKTLFLQNIGFDVSTTGGGSLQQLTIVPFGLELDNTEIKMEIDGSVVNAEIEDLNSDGYPEVLIYTVSAGSGSYGNVIGYSVNAGKSISQIYFPPIAENKEASKGYMGHDEFAIVETTLVQRFRIYNNGDTNANPTGNWRQIQYQLKDGEASRKFVLDKVVEYPIN